MEYKEIYLNGELSHYIMYIDGTIINTETQKEIKPWVNSHGRYEICLSHKGKKYFKRIARLKAQLFIPNPYNLPEVDHINGNRLDDDINNLEWVTSEENIQRAKNLGIQTQIGEKSHLAILTENEVREICIKLEQGYSCKELAEKYNISRTEISDIKNGKVWNHVSSNYNIIKGKRNTLMIEDVIQICFLLKDGVKQKDIAKMFNVTPDTIGKIKRKERWADVTEGLL